jgi:acetylornithine deacetylase
MNNNHLHILQEKALLLLQQLIAIPSLSRKEDKTADCFVDFFQAHEIPHHRDGNNVWVTNKYFDKYKPSILLNAHHDTVPANAGYTRNPHEPTIADGKLYGLGSTDAGASLVSLLACFLYYYEAHNLLFNVVFAATAEEEISGANGIESLFALPAFKGYFDAPASFAIVGEPTQLQLAIAEKGLMVLDCTALGKAGHAAREEGDNALYKAMEAIAWFKNYQFDEVSPFLGAVKMTVTSIDTTNKAHNIIPAECKFVVDIRLNELYTHEKILAIIRQHVCVTVTARSTRIRATSIAVDHPIVKAGIAMGKTVFGSPTTSDKALIPLPTLKVGDGFSGQSHSADEFVLLKDLEEGVLFYIELLGRVVKSI